MTLILMFRNLPNSPPRATLYLLFEGSSRVKKLKFASDLLLIYLLRQFQSSGWDSSFQIPEGFDQIWTYSGDPIMAKEVSKSFTLPMILGKDLTFLLAEDHQTLQQNSIVERLVTPLFDQFAPIFCFGWLPHSGRFTFARSSLCLCCHQTG